MKQIIFEVEGMHCRSCEVLIEDALGEIGGVESVKISYQEGIVKVEFDESKTSLSEIEKIIVNEGYKVKDRAVTGVRD
ncbi:heavy-metal-associated domain-containing protein [Candidatus Woesearchaeota archaeon]|nr:heavy-metal-associated domain-containing protein [Candidatus Woesearchaeota archaeon]MBL7051270.1 heavy-metal-associated domain-containing protein [Candidatus Woesearchaeota archaeon]